MKENETKENLNKKGMPTWAIVLICILGFMAFIVFAKSFISDTENLEDPSSEIETEKASTEKNNKNLKVIKNEKLVLNFTKACEQINIDVSKIKNVNKVEDWNSGQRYTFMYEGQTFILYSLDNGDVSSITISNKLLDKIYLDGYEPLDVNDFLFDLSTSTDLDVAAERKIKEYIKYPSTAKFNWISYSHARRYDIFQITGTFTAKNIMGIEADHKFLIEFKKNGNDYSVVYLMINNDKYIGTESQLKTITRKEIKVDEPKAEDGIILKDGAIGTYGKIDKFDGEDYIRYYIPAGTYKVEALTKNAQFFIETVKIHKEDGWDTATAIRNIKLNKVGDTDEFTITSDQCISLVMYTQIKLTKN